MVFPQDYIDRHKPGADGKIHITTDYPDVFSGVEIRQERCRAAQAMGRRSRTRAYPKNRDVLQKMIQTRYEIATLLGYASWADYNAADKMIVKGGNIGDFIQQLDNATRPLVKREFAMLLAEKQKTRSSCDRDCRLRGLSPTSSEMVRRSQYDFDSQTVRPYLPYMQVKQGILDTAAKLFHVTVPPGTGRSPRGILPSRPGMVIENGKAIGRFYLDMHPRKGKLSHAEMVPVLDGIRGKQLPEATLVCNLPVPTASDPGLMEYGDVVTFFHEFGHLMHHILGGRGDRQASAALPWKGISSKLLRKCSRNGCAVRKCWRRLRAITRLVADSRGTGRSNEPGVGIRTGKLGRDPNPFTAISYGMYKSRPKS